MVNPQIRDFLDLEAIVALEGEEENEEEDDSGKSHKQRPFALSHTCCIQPMTSWMTMKYHTIGLASSHRLTSQAQYHRTLRTKRGA